MMLFWRAVVKLIQKSLGANRLRHHERNLVRDFHQPFLYMHPNSQLSIIYGFAKYSHLPEADAKCGLG